MLRRSRTTGHTQRQNEYEPGVMYHVWPCIVVVGIVMMTIAIVLLVIEIQQGDNGRIGGCLVFLLVGGAVFIWSIVMCFKSRGRLDANENLLPSTSQPSSQADDDAHDEIRNSGSSSSRISDDQEAAPHNYRQRYHEQHSPYPDLTIVTHMPPAGYGTIT